MSVWPDVARWAPFINHLHFIARHRGELEAGTDGFRIRGPTPDLSTWTPGPMTEDLPPDFPTVRLAPWCDAAWPMRLQDAGYRAAERLAYMELGDLAERRPAGRELSIDVVRSPTAARTFAAVQAEGFATRNPDIDDWWCGYFASMAERNCLDTDQTFYLAWYGDEPVATTLVLRSAGVHGVYAVATRAEFQRRGFATALLVRAYADARVRGQPRVILQALAGSYAAGLYTRLGFRTSYELDVWRRD